MQGLPGTYPEGPPHRGPDGDQVRELQGRDQEEGTGKQPHRDGEALCRRAAQGNDAQERRPLGFSSVVFSAEI